MKIRLSSEEMDEIGIKTRIKAEIIIRAEKKFQFGSKNVLWMVDTFTRFIQGKVLKNKEALTVVDALNEAWNWRVGFPSRGFWADNGGEFQNGEMEEFTSEVGFSIKFGPSYSPWSNRMNERKPLQC